MFLTHFFLVKKNYDMCFDNLIKFYASNYYYIAQTIWYQPTYTSIWALKDRFFFF
jgi:hypothetical protein